jgi:hypothetical protein
MQMKEIHNKLVHFEKLARFADGERMTTARANKELPFC